LVPKLLKNSHMHNSDHARDPLPSEFGAVALSCAAHDVYPTDQTGALVSRLLQESKPQEALELLVAALAKNETSDLWNDWATVQYVCGELAQAEAGYGRALDLDCSDRQAAVNLGLLLFAQGRIRESMPLLEQHRATLTLQEKQKINQLTAYFQANPAQVTSPIVRTPTTQKAPHRPKVSVLIPSYNHEAFVAAAIQSVQAQTFQDFEIIVADDGSQDNTADVIAAQNEPRLNLMRFSANRGASAAMNDTVRQSKGEYLCLLNSDDCFLPHKLERQVAFLDAHLEIGAVFAYPSFIDETGTPIAPNSTFVGRIFEVPNRSQSDWLRHFFFAGNCLCHPTIMIRRKCYEVTGIYDERLAQLPDFDMWIRLVAAFPIYVIAEPLTGYRVLMNGRNMSASRADSVVRTEWEETLVRRHYLSMSTMMFALIFAPELAALGLNAREDRRAVLGRICQATNSPMLHRFALELLYEALPSQSDGSRLPAGITYPAYIHETGNKDVYNTLAKYNIAELEQRLKKAEVGSEIAQVVRSVRAWESVPVDGSRLNLGCGTNILPGWENLDLEPSPGARFWDATQGIPIQSESVRLIFCEHFIEHLDLASVLRFLAECHRVLVSGGVLRISTPDLRYLMDQYRRQNTSEWADLGWVAQTPCDLMNEGMRLWGHQYVFDEPKLRDCILKTGFRAVASVPWRQSTIAELAGRETRPFHQEIIFETQKKRL
jgi:glycosyltransferase involved in cell wall biosynthesis/predicted SAM-dependent methyltransferase